MTNMTEFHISRLMNKINKLSKNKHYDVVFFDKNQECCGTIENITGISNKYDINDYALDVCTKIPRHALVTEQKVVVGHYHLIGSTENFRLFVIFLMRFSN